MSNGIAFRSRGSIHGLALLLLVATPGLLTGQDTNRVRTDSVRPVPLEPVTVTRRLQRWLEVAGTLQIVDSAVIRNASLQNGLDEVLGSVPGVFAMNRYNPSLDQRVVIRGAGSRSNFGIRGIKLLIDGIPQTLPDGQSQLTNLDLGFVDGIEILGGSASALYGNAAGGVVALSSSIPMAPIAIRGRFEMGSAGIARFSEHLAVARGFWSGRLVVTNYRASGFRQHSATRNTQVAAAINRILQSGWTIKARYFYADVPRAENPGALTASELAINPDSAAANNILRAADKSVRQHQAGVTMVGALTDGIAVDATVFGLSRQLENPLATAPPGPGGPTVGTWNGIDRTSGGARLTVSHHASSDFDWTAGVDYQVMSDHRINRRAAGGAPSDTVTLDQRENTTELGPFLGLRMAPISGVSVNAIGRWDQVGFRVRDVYLGDSIDNSGRSNFDAWSGAGGVSLALTSRTAGYLSASTAFETPTTTELVNQSNDSVGFNDRLKPQRTVTVEGGIRTVGRRFHGSAAIFRSRVRDGLIPLVEQDGRAYYGNVAGIVIRGVELGGAWVMGPIIRLEASYTHNDARFDRYRATNGPVVDTLDGNQMPGVPRHLLRLAVGTVRNRVSLRYDQQLVSRYWADDRNSSPVEGLGIGVGAIRGQLDITIGKMVIAPFASVNNLWNRRYVASANINGFSGRVYEPAPGRWAVIGIEIEASRFGSQDPQE